MHCIFTIKFDQIPYFIEELKITHLDLGNTMPAIRRGGYPYFDDQGFWVDTDINYEGGFKMTIETKVNLMRFKHDTADETQDIQREPSRT